jgi:hypothetical protein
MRDLDRRHQISTCERLKLDGSTCYTVNPGEMQVICGGSRDKASGLAAAWIEKNIPERESEAGQEASHQ